MEGFGVSAYKWVNAAGKAICIKYHWKPAAGVHSFDHHESTRLADHLIDNIVNSLGYAGKEIQEQMVKNLTGADAELGKRAAGGLKL